MSTGLSTVFVIDDDPSVQRSLSRLLRSAGYAVEECTSARAFLDRPDPEGTACVILDLRMPRMSGQELFDRMVEAGRSLPVIFLTGHADVPTSVHAMKEGAVDFLQKPVDSDTLLSAVRSALDRHAIRRARDDRWAATRERLAVLTRREREVMEQVVKGHPNKLIASTLGISEKTVKVHRHRVMEKTQTESLAELVRLADTHAALRPGSGHAMAPFPAREKGVVRVRPRSD